MRRTAAALLFSLAALSGCDLGVELPLPSPDALLLPSENPPPSSTALTFNATTLYFWNWVGERERTLLIRNTSSEARHLRVKAPSLYAVSDVDFVLAPGAERHVRLELRTDVSGERSDFAYVSADTSSVWGISLVANAELAAEPPCLRTVIDSASGVPALQADDGAACSSLPDGSGICRDGACVTGVSSP